MESVPVGARLNNQNAKKIGSGAYSVVQSSESFAHKIISIDLLDSAIREIGFILACSHPNIIKIDEITYDNNISFRMEKYSYNLAWYLVNTELNLNIVYYIADNISAGLAYLHARGIIHCDLKPQNILMRGMEVVICDLGISVLSEEKKHTSRICTSTYRAPEINFAASVIEFTDRIDMWSLGCILYELIIRAPLFDSNTEDSSLLACSLYKLNAPSRSRRISLLNYVRIEYAIETISKLIPSDILAGIKASGYLRIMAMCLLPKPERRFSSRECKAALYEITHFRPVVNYSRLHISTFELDELTCTTCVSPEIISTYVECLNLAENIFLMYGNSRTTTFSDQLACLYIAGCVYSRYSIDKHILEIMDKQELREHAIKILLALQGKIL